MDLQTRKIALVQEFLSIESEELISRFEKLLTAKKDFSNFSPMTIEELNRRIDQSMNDSKNGGVIDANEFLKEIAKWE